MKLAIALFLMMTLSAHAQDTDSGNFMLPYCKKFVAGGIKDQGPYEGVCVGVVRALGNLGMHLPNNINNCRPSGVTTDQMVMVVVQYMENKPQALHENFSVLAAQALHAAWPCTPRGGWQ
jgi:Rap1a immunity proteins